MTDSRLQMALTFALAAAGGLLIRIAPEPRYLDDPRWYLVFAGIALFGAGLGAFLAMVASAIGAAIRTHRAERSAERAGGDNPKP